MTVTDEVMIVQGSTACPEPAYSVLWVIRLDADDRCREFTGCRMEHPAPTAG
ncbi:hypothetical protein ABZ260_39030 [Streptosporangium sp. NPDC006013]|uniref:hypothetical protein n=1 Tax=Streptosporangium sp. NPDC006013 TaxID=3155596 RepID=UPI0033B291D9